jgi:hypothetical protein
MTLACLWSAALKSSFCSPGKTCCKVGAPLQVSAALSQPMPEARFLSPGSSQLAAARVKQPADGNAQLEKSTSEVV